MDARQETAQEVRPEEEEEEGPGPADLRALPVQQAPRAQEGVERVPVPVSRASGLSYLVRTEDGDGSRLEFFDDILKEGMTARDHLVLYLTSLIEINRYSIGPAIVGVWRWDRDDSRHEMHLTITKLVNEMDDYQDEHWLMRDLLNEDADVRFVVRIDRKRS